MPKVHFYEADTFRLFRDESMEWMLDDEDKIDVPQEILEEYEKSKKEFDAVQKKLYNLRKEQKEY